MPLRVRTAFGGMIDVLSVQGKVAKWWIPDDVVFVKEIPHTATGKVYKLKLRQLFKDFRFDNSRL